MTDVTVTIFVHVPQILQCLRRTISLLVVNIPLSKLANFIYFKARFPVVSMNTVYLHTGSFQKLTKPCKGGWLCIDGFGDDFRVHWGCMKQWSVDGDFVPCKNEGKDLHVQRKHFYYNAIDQGILATSKPKLWTMSLLRLWFAVIVRTTEETHACNFAALC